MPPVPWVLISLSPQQYGFYSAFMGHFVYFFLGTSRMVTLGPTAIKSLLVSYTFHEPTCAEVLAFLGGCMHVALGLQLLGKTLRPSCFGGGLPFALPGVLDSCLLGMPCPQHFLLCIQRADPVCVCVCVLERYPPPSAQAHSAQRSGHLGKCPGPQTLASLSCSPNQPKKDVSPTSPTHTTSPSPRPPMSSGTEQSCN